MGKKTWTWTEVKQFVKEKNRFDRAPLKKFGDKEFVLAGSWYGRMVHPPWFEYGINIDIGDLASGARGRNLYTRVVLTRGGEYPRGTSSLYLRPKNLNDQNALKYIMAFHKEYEWK